MYNIPDRRDIEPQSDRCPDCGYPYDGERCERCREIAVARETIADIVRSFPEVDVIELRTKSGETVKYKRK